MGAGQLSPISAAMLQPGSQGLDTTPVNLGTPLPDLMPGTPEFPYSLRGAFRCSARKLRTWQGGQRPAEERSTREVIMIDPFFFDRLMHAFTTANSTPLSHAAEHAATSQRAPASTGEASACRALREAEAVAAAELRREHTAPAESDQADGPAESG